MNFNLDTSMLAGTTVLQRQAWLAEAQSAYAQLMIPIQGVLVHGDGYCWWGETSYGALRAMLEQAAADAEVRAIVLHVDSPGGEVAG